MNTSRSRFKLKEAAALKEPAKQERSGFRPAARNVLRATCWGRGLATAMGRPGYLSDGFRMKSE
jgi:hypothetical protein